MAIWLLIILSGVITFSMRFLPLSNFIPKKLPYFIQEGIKFVSLSLLTPIIIYSILVDNQTSIGVADNPKVYASVIAIFIALASRSIIITLISGLLIIWIFELII